MKKLITVALILALLLPAAALASSPEVTERFSTFGRCSDAPGLCPYGDCFSLDLFFSYDLTAYVVLTVWNFHDVSTTVKTGTIKTSPDEPGVLYIVFGDGSRYSFTYENEDRTAVWLNTGLCKIRMKYANWFVPPTDFSQE